MTCLPERYRDVDLEAHLVSIGLVGSAQIGGVSYLNGWTVEHSGSAFRVEVTPPSDGFIDSVISLALLSAVGEQLIRIVQVPEAKGLVEALSAELADAGVRFVQIE